MPRPRFTLRVALALMAIAALLAWQGGIVVNRRVAMQSSHAFILHRQQPGQRADEVPRFNPLRAILGDEPVWAIFVDPEIDTPAERQRLQRIFPEAAIEDGNKVWTF